MDGLNTCAFMHTQLNNSRKCDLAEAFTTTVKIVFANASQITWSYVLKNVFFTSADPEYFPKFNGWVGGKGNPSKLSRNGINPKAAALMLGIALLHSACFPSVPVDGSLKRLCFVVIILPGSEGSFAVT